MDFSNKSRRQFDFHWDWVSILRRIWAAELVFEQRWRAFIENRRHLVKLALLLKIIPVSFGGFRIHGAMLEWRNGIEPYQCPCSLDSTDGGGDTLSLSNWLLTLQEAFAEFGGECIRFLRLARFFFLFNSLWQIVEINLNFHRIWVCFSNFPPFVSIWVRLKLSFQIIYSLVYLRLKSTVRNIQFLAFNLLFGYLGFLLDIFSTQIIDSWDPRPRLSGLVRSKFSRMIGDFGPKWKIGRGFQMFFLDWRPVPVECLESAVLSGVQIHECDTEFFSRLYRDWIPGSQTAPGLYCQISIWVLLRDKSHILQKDQEHGVRESPGVWQILRQNIEFWGYMLDSQSLRGQIHVFDRLSWRLLVGFGHPPQCISIENILYWLPALESLRFLINIWSMGKVQWLIGRFYTSFGHNLAPKCDRLERSKLFLLLLCLNSLNLGLLLLLEVPLTPEEVFHWSWLLQDCDLRCKCALGHFRLFLVVRKFSDLLTDSFFVLMGSCVDRRLAGLETCFPGSFVECVVWFKYLWMQKTEIRHSLLLSQSDARCRFSVSLVRADLWVLSLLGIHHSFRWEGFSLIYAQRHLLRS